MAWIIPRTWSPGELVTSGMLNQEIRDKLMALKDPPSSLWVLDEANDYTLTATSFVDVSNALALTLNTNGGDLFVGFSGSLTWGGSGTGVRSVYFDIEIDGERVGGDDGVIVQSIEGNNRIASISFTRLITNMSSGQHTVKLKWKLASSGTMNVTMFAGSGTSGGDIHPQFWVREIS